MLPRLIRMETQSNSQCSKNKSWFDSAVMSSSLHNNLKTHSAATPSVHLEISRGNFQLSFLRRWCISDPHWPDVQKARSSRAGCNRYDRTRSASVPRACVCYSASPLIYSQRNAPFLAGLIKLREGQQQQGKESRSEIKQDKVQPLGRRLEVFVIRLDLTRQTVCHERP